MSQANCCSILFYQHCVFASKIKLILILHTEGLVEIQPSCCANSQSTDLLVFQDGGKLNAEIRWVLTHVVGGYSDNSVTGSVNLFQSMFPDSKIASIMELGKDKLKYVVNYDIAP